ncbi:hypothetical protein MRB53_040376 [Persea americana]|nr:hypothetical protein MRB53_040376 [Persea americana]
MQGFLGRGDRNVHSLPTSPSALKAPATFLTASAACCVNVFSSSMREALTKVRRVMYVRSIFASASAFVFGGFSNDDGSRRELRRRTGFVIFCLEWSEWDFEMDLSRRKLSGTREEHWHGIDAVTY